MFYSVYPIEVFVPHLFELCLHVEEFVCAVVLVFVKPNFSCPLGLESPCIGAFCDFVSLHLQLPVGFRLVYRAHFFYRFGIGDF